ncbi:DUF6428 family protein [Robiginitalea sediminis]|uniref:DUF6428 family protein n=1 Tax=Robiginitalea sediminis TaxID=1982593 RepID=UPI000B4AA79A|nr:DUF6428 family protein [Robiginitalea sediminis]
MTTREFISLLQSHPNHILDFEYRPGEHLRPDYHITEVKNVYIDATDCGGRTDSWQETLIQLWEAPNPEPHHGPITSDKALSILGRVAQQKPLLMESTLKFEYGNASFHTGQLHVALFQTKGETLTFTLSTEATQCKAQELCGVGAPMESSSGCTPGSGCC